MGGKVGKLATWCHHLKSYSLSSQYDFSLTYSVFCVSYDMASFIHWVQSVKAKGKAADLYRGSMQSEDHRRTALQYLSFIGPNMPLPTIRRFWHEGPRKVPRYQVILLGEQRHMSSNVSYDSPIMQVVQRVLDSWRLAASWAVYTT